MLAKEIASIDRVSGGRFAFDVGIGWSAEEFAALGIPFERRAQPLRGDGGRHDDGRRRTAAELVLEGRELVVERRRARDAEPPRRDRQLVRAVRERDVEAAAARPAAELAEAVRVVARGEALLAPTVTRRLLDRFADRLPGPAASPRELATLPAREAGLRNPALKAAQLIVIHPRVCVVAECSEYSGSVVCLEIS